jgi:hypothetical protein
MYYYPSVSLLPGDDSWGGPPGPQATPPSAQPWLRLCYSVWQVANLQRRLPIGANSAGKKPVSLSFPESAQLFDFCRAVPPGPQPTPGSARRDWMKLISLQNSGSWGTRADQGVRPTSNSEFRETKGLATGLREQEQRHPTHLPGRARCHR